ncbi:MAG TPA: D-2-hydroxyacid dehydrogenase [Capsulimonadaceae bacterium]|nr:D-2-hydroxyacid dehydrogenase [Capsulimonadaceae bacterium]
MIILVPSQVHDEFAKEAASSVPEARLVAYADDGPAPAELDQAEAVIRWVGGGRFSDLVEKGPKVRWLHTASAGVDHVLTPAVRAKQGLVVTDSGAAFTDSIPEFVIAWILMVSRRLPQLIAQQRERKWQWIQQEELTGRTVGIVGFGPIGQGVAIRAKALGMKVLGFRRHDSPVPSVDEIFTGQGGLRKLLEGSDYVVIAASLTEETRALIGPQQLGWMKPTAWIINIARGGLIDEGALIDALREGLIAGACLDVFAKEPLPHESPLWDLPNVYIAPHNSSGGTPELREKQKAVFFDNLRRFVHGEPLQGVVDIQRGY